MTTRHSNAGSSAGRKPMNDTTVAFGSYPLPSAATRCAVPVFPATVTPSIWARRPVPLLTAPARIFLNSAAVDSDTTRRMGWGDVSFIISPFAPRVAFNMRGAKSMPPLAMAPKACTNCIAVVPTSCPIAIVSKERSDQFLACSSNPALSAGKPTPLRMPKPKLRIYS